MGFFSSLFELNVAKLVFQVFFCGFFYIYLGIRVVFRKYQHFEAAKQPVHFYPGKLKLKLALNLLLILTYIASIFFALFDRNYWFFNKTYYVPFYLVPIVVIYLECDALLFHFRRRISVRMNIHSLSWLMIATGQVLTIITYYYQHQSNFHLENILLDVVKSGVTVLRALIQVKYPQDREQFEYSSIEESLLTQTRSILREAPDRKISPMSSSSPLDLSYKSSEKGSASGFSINIKSTKQVNGELFYTLQVFVGSESYKILRSVVAFRELQATLKPILLQSSRGKNSALNMTFESPTNLFDYSRINSSLNALQKFVNSVIEVCDPLPEDFLKFIEVPNVSRKKIKMLHRSYAQGASGESFDSSSFDSQTGLSNSLGGNGSQALNTGDEQPKKSMTLSRVKKSNTVAKKLTLEGIHSDVNVVLYDCQQSITGEYKYVFSISLFEKPDESWIISKRYLEFKALHSRLKKLLDKEIPKLPKQRIMKSEAEMLPQLKKDLENYLSTLLNEKSFVSTTEVARFVEVSPKIQDHLLNKGSFKDYSRYSASISDNKVHMGADNVAITLFKVEVYRDEDHMQAPNSNKYVLYKRFADFEELHKALIIKFGKSISGKLPSLPQKFNAYFGQTSVEYRMSALQVYFNELFKFPKIGESYAFRTFLEMPKRRETYRRNVLGRISFRPSPLKPDLETQDANSIEQNQQQQLSLQEWDNIKVNMGSFPGVIDLED